MPLRTIQDLEAIKHLPRASRLTVRSTYELIREAATQDPERTAIALLAGSKRSDRPVRLSYRALLNTVHQTANLLADLSIEPTDVIALLLPQLLETHLVLWGGQAAGIVCPISPWLPGEARRRPISGLSSAAPGAPTARGAHCGPGARMPGRSSSRLFPLEMFFEADEALVADDEVVDQLDVQDAAGLHQLLRRLDILRRRGRVSTGVVVAEDDPRAVAHNSWTEDLGGTQDRTVDGALIAMDVVHDLIFRVKN